MKVLLTADAVGGVWTYALELIAGLSTRGVDVHLAVMGPLDDRQRLAAAMRAGAVQAVHHPGALEWMADPWDDLDAAGEWLLELEAALDPDVVHLDSFVHASLGFRAPVISVGHSCVLSWWEAVKDEPAPPTWGRYRSAVASGLEAAAEVVAPSRWMLDGLRRIYGIAAGRVIHNGLDVSIDRGPREPLVVAAGRLWDQAKNLDAVLHAAPRLEWPVVIAGADTEAPNVRALGQIQRDELLQRLAGASVFVHPARYEPFGLGPLEAAASGCALVLGDIGSLRELWEGAAVFVDPEDPRALADRCNELIRDDDLRAAMAHRAVERAGVYSRRAMADAYLSLYRETLDREAPKTGVRT